MHDPIEQHMAIGDASRLTHPQPHDQRPVIQPSRGGSLVAKAAQHLPDRATGFLLDLQCVFLLRERDAAALHQRVAQPVVPFARIVDGVLLVVKERGAEIATVRRTVDELKRSGGNVIGIVLNRDHESREATLSPDDESWLAAEDLAP